MVSKRYKNASDILAAKMTGVFVGRRKELGRFVGFRVKTRYRNLRALKLEEWQVHQMANSRKGYWRTAQMLSVALTNKIIAKLGYISMLDYYLKVT